jgi:hypothetical protein
VTSFCRCAVLCCADVGGSGTARALGLGLIGDGDEHGRLMVMARRQCERGGGVIDAWLCRQLQALLVVGCMAGKWAGRQYCYVSLAVLAAGAGGDAVTWWWRGAFRFEVRGGLDCCWTLVSGTARRGRMNGRMNARDTTKSPVLSEIDGVSESICFTSIHSTNILYFPGVAS